MRALLPAPADDVDVHAVYATDWVDGGGIRANFISSVDGAVSAGGLSRGLQTPGDNTVFNALRDLADVVLVGAGTARAEKYGAVRPSGDRLARRREHGLPDALPIAVVTYAGNLDEHSSLFDTQDDNRTVVIVVDAIPDDRRAALAAVGDLVVAGATEVDFGIVRDALRERGLTRVICEGGPGLFADVVGAGQLDELCLTYSPMIVGPGPGRIVSGDPFTGDPRGLALTSLLEEDGALFARYRRAL